MKNIVKLFFKRITDDLKLKKLIPLKMLFFVHASTLFVLYPYLTIHMRELGINVEETAIMSALTPVVSIVMPPLAGMLADKIGNFRLLLALSSALGGVSGLLLLAVPVGRLTITYPPYVELLARCQHDTTENTLRLHMQHFQEYPCHRLHPFSYDVNLTSVTCGFACDVEDGGSNSMIRANAYDIHVESELGIQNLIYRHSIPDLHAYKTLKKDHSTSRTMRNDPHFNITINKISDRLIFFPTPDLYNMRCDNETCNFGNEISIVSNLSEVNTDTKFRARISHDDTVNTEIAGSYWIYHISNINKKINNNEVGNIMCKDNFDQGSKVWVHVGSSKLSRCSAACAVSTPRSGICENKQQQIEIDPSFTFWTYLAVRVFIGIIGGTAFAMFEGAVIAIIREQKADYGLQRVYGNIGGMISSPLSGLLIDYASRGKGYTDFRPAFYLYAVLKVVSGVLMLSINLEFKQPAQNLLEDVITVFKNVEIVALFIACFIMGTAWGYIESFLFWLLQDLGASRSLMGITITVGGIAGLPLLVLSGPIITRLGHANIIFIGFVFYAIRLLGYSLIYNPWLCLIFEALESVTSSLSFTAAVTYAARLSSTTTDTSVQGLLGGLYYGVGKGSGSLIGGYLMKFFGTRPTYQIFAAATFATGCVYFLFNTFYIRKRITSDDNDICKKAPLDVECRQSIKQNDTPCKTIDGVVKQTDEKSENSNIEEPPLNQKVDVDSTSDSGVITRHIMTQNLNEKSSQREPE